MVDVVERWVLVDGVNTHYLGAGSTGAPVLLLHGGGTDSASLSYSQSIQPIAEQHRVFAPDWPGYGKSDKPDIKHSLQYYIAFLERFIDVLGLEKASLVGISLGGGAALGFTLRRPQHVNKLVLVNSYGLGDKIPFGKFSYLWIHAPAINEVLWSLLGSSRRLVKWSLTSIVHNPQAITDELVDEVYRAIKDTGTKRAFISFQRSETSWSGLRTNFTDRLHEITVPSLIIHGAKDNLVPISWAERAHELIKDSELRVFPTAGHWVPREEPDAFNKAVLQFLKDVPRQPI